MYVKIQNYQVIFVNSACYVQQCMLWCLRHIVNDVNCDHGDQVAILDFYYMASKII